MDGKERRRRILMLKEQIETLFEHYLTAFKAYDLNAVVACYHQSCTLHTPDKLVLIKCIDDCRQEFNDIFSQLQQAKIGDIKALNASYTLITEELLVVSIDWAFIDEQGEIFADFCAIYHLALIDDELKIINVVSHELSNSLTLEQPLELTR